MFKLKETEFDKISHELLSKIYPMEELQNYYYLGVAETLKTLSQVVNGYNKHLSIDELNYLINHFASQNEKIKEYYGRLKSNA